MIIAQISDLHLRTDGHKLKGIVDSVGALDAVVRHLNALEPRPDVVLATGDLANKAHVQDYETLEAMLRTLSMAFYVIPGNHDDRAMMRDVFAKDGYFPPDGKFLHYTVEDWPVRMIALDTKADRRDGGEMCPERLAWLDARLGEQPDRPTVVFMHHPPFKTGIGFMDKQHFDGAEDFEALIRRHPQVERIVAGHLHRTISKRFGGTVASVCSSSAFQMALDLRPDVGSSFVKEPPTIPILLWRDDTGLVAHHSQLGDFGPRHPFVRDPL
ncbi:phosphodiesterase [Varunaivibrio sulfuroxidans]|nr:phosphodiesterase [Varunaivibrio sulfuroxidans]WES31532.1 phosphodiesterase [Varunaivibrio sulfuroxidans]